MKQAEFDRFADEYRASHASNIRVTGETPEYFAEYKVVELRRQLRTSAFSARRILDFGGGVGNSVPYLRRHFPELKIVVADVSTRSLAIAHKRFPGMAEYLQISDSQIPVADASFDIVFTACVFHHIDHSGHTHWLAEIKRVLVPGGVFGLFEHNPWNPLTRRAVNTCPFDENARLISMPNMRTRLREAGFNVLRSRFTFFFPSFLRGLRALETRMGWLPLGGQYFLLAQK